MSLSEKDVTKIAKLARIGLTDDEKKNLTSDLGRILELVKQLAEVNTDNIEPMVNVNNDVLPTRKDVVADGNYADKIIKNSALAEYNCFAVPKVVE